MVIAQNALLARFTQKEGSENKMRYGLLDLHKKRDLKTDK